MTERDPLDFQADAEAAREAGSIGGRAPEGEDPARRPVEEAGGGEAEGYEQAEEALRENAEHGKLGPRNPLRDSFTPEEESDRADVEYGEADEEQKPDA